MHTPTPFMKPLESLLDERGLFRAGLQVPRDQRDLLERSDAWAELMRKTPQGLLNVPPHVLDNLKTFHAQKTASAPAASQSSQESRYEPIPWTQSPPRNIDARGAVAAPAVPTSPSPPQIYHPRASAARDSRSRDRTQALPPSTATNSGLQSGPSNLRLGISSSKTGIPNTQPSPGPIQSPSERESPPTQRDTPSSSNEADSEDEQMAVEPPMPLLTSFPRSINKAAVPVNPTPPSAQIMSCIDKGNLDRQEPKIIRRRMKNALRLLDKCLGDISDCDLQVQEEALQPRTTTSAQRRSEKRNPVSPKASREPSCPEAYASNNISQRETESPTAPSYQHTNTAKSTSRTAHSRTGSATASEHASQVERDPLQVFRMKYPDFKGSLDDFLGACVTLEWLAKTCALKAFLFDDFVRFYCDDYLILIESLDNDAPHPRAIDSYNKDETPPRYLKGVLSTSALRRVLTVYSNEIVILEGNSTVQKPLQESRVMGNGIPLDMEIDQSVEISIADNAEEYVEDERVATQSSPGGRPPPLLPEADELDDVEDDRFYRSSREASPDLGTPISSGQRHPAPPSAAGIKTKSTKSDAPATGANLDLALASSAACDLIIPNTSASLLDANSLRIPETVHKPKPRQVIEGTKEKPFRLIASLSNRDSPTSSMSSSQRKRRFSEYLARSGQKSEV